MELWSQLMQLQNAFIVEGDSVMITNVKSGFNVSCFHKSQPLVPILNQINPVYNLFPQVS
jgi:hypothetical protein